MCGWHPVGMRLFSRASYPVVSLRSTSGSKPFGLMGGVRLRKIAMATEHFEKEEVGRADHLPLVYQFGIQEDRKGGMNRECRRMSGFNLPGFMASKFKMRQHPFTPLQNGA